MIKSYGLGILPGVVNRSSGREEVKKLTGSYAVPVLVTDEVIGESRRTVEWAEANPAG